MNILSDCWYNDKKMSTGFRRDATEDVAEYEDTGCTTGETPRS